jgi:Fe-S oxidoreductase
MQQMTGRTAADTAEEARVRAILARKADMIRLSLSACVHCSLCSESCFKYRASGGDPTYTPSYKAINTIGRIFRSRGRLTDAAYGEIRELAWNKCVLCTRCYCPVGISVPSLIAAARSVCRERGVFRRYDGEVGA